MSKTFELKDNSVVVVIGSGAGGGTLSNELTQRGASVVCLEADRASRSRTSSMTTPRCSAG